MDVFKANNTDLEAMRLAMTVTCTFFIPSVLAFLVVAKVLPRDWAAADKRNADLAKQGS